MKSTKLKMSRPNTDRTMVTRAYANRAWREVYANRRAYFATILDHMERHRMTINELEKLQSERPDTMPAHIVTEMMELYDNMHRDVECGVCLEPMTKENAKFTSCGHKFCGPCLDDVREKTPLAMRGKPECPTCRMALNPKYM